MSSCDAAFREAAARQTRRLNRRVITHVQRRTTVRKVERTLTRITADERFALNQKALAVAQKTDL
jgi:hypothetical protein